MFSVASSRLLRDQRAAAARSEQVEDKLWRITCVSVTRTSSSSTTSSAATSLQQLGLTSDSNLSPEELKNVWENRKHLIERGQREKLEKKAREFIEADQRKIAEKAKKKQDKKDKEAKKQRDKEEAKRKKKGGSNHGTGDDEGSPPIRALGNNYVALNRHASDPTMVYHPHLETTDLAPGTPGIAPIPEGGSMPSSRPLPPPLSGSTSTAASSERSTRVHFGGGGASSGTSTSTSTSSSSSTPLTRGGSGFILTTGVAANGRAAGVVSSPSQNGQPAINGAADKRGVLSSPPRDPAATPSGGLPPLTSSAATAGTPTHRNHIEPPSPIPPRAGVPAAAGGSRFPVASSSSSSSSSAARPPSRGGSSSSKSQLHDDDEPDTDHEHEKPHGADSESDPDDDEVNHKAKVAYHHIYDMCCSLLLLILILSIIIGLFW